MARSDSNSSTLIEGAKGFQNDNSSTDLEAKASTTSSTNESTNDATIGAISNTSIDTTTNDPPIHEMQIEDYPQGYPRYSALLASDKSFQLWRRFSTLRTRLLLIKQDELSELEEQLMAIDKKDEKENPLSLISRRSDGNEGRKDLLNKIDDALKEYDSFLERNQRVFSFEAASIHAVSSLRNWLRGYASVKESETRYIYYPRGIVGLLGNSTWLERLAEKLAVKIITLVSKTASPRLRTRDTHVIIPEEWERGLMVALMVLQAAVIAALLLAPVIICNYIDDLTYRVVIVVLTTAAFIAGLSCLPKVKALDLVVAGATYATVLVVFISGTNGISHLG